MLGILLGNLGGDAELKYTSEQKPFVSFSVADNVGWGDKKRTVWYRCTWWGERAVKMAQYLKKGAMFQVVGEVAPRDWQDKDGVTHTAQELTVSTVNFAGKREGASAPAAVAKPGAPVQTPLEEDLIPF